MINSFYDSSKSVISFFSEPYLETISYVKTFIENRWFPPPFETSLKEIAERFRYQNQFYNLCTANGIYDRQFRPEEIEPQDTILISPPAQPCKPEYKELPSPELQANLKLAESIFQYVQKKVPHSPNYESRSFKEGEPSPVNKKFNFPGKAMAVYLDPELTLWELAKAIEIKKSGYCEDMAYVGLVHAWTRHPDKNVEIAGISGGRHTFLVVGRDKTSDFKDYTTWGENCVICDPWAGKYYPLSALETEMYDFRSGVLGNSGITYPYVRPFNPQTQHIYVVFKPLSAEARRWLIFGGEKPSSISEKN